MKTIYQFSLYIGANKHFLKMPQGARFVKTNPTKLMVERGVDNIGMWFEVDTDKPQQERMFHLIETGASIDASLTYIDTCFLNIDYVIHIFEELKK